MALIKCIECGNEISAKATNCVHCGCPIAETLRATSNKHIPNSDNIIEYEVDNDSTYCKACMNCGSIHWHSTAEGYRGGFCLGCRSRNEYDKLKKIDYKIQDVLQHIGKEPKGDAPLPIYSMQVSKWGERIISVERQLFEKYVRSWDTLDKDSDGYKSNIKRIYQGRSPDKLNTNIENNNGMTNTERDTIKNFFIVIGVIIAVILLILGFKSCGSNNEDKCGACNGSGYYQKKTCPICDGSGYSDYDPYDHYRNIG